MFLRRLCNTTRAQLRLFPFNLGKSKKCAGKGREIRWHDNLLATLVCALNSYSVMMQVKSKIVGHNDFVRALATAGERLLTASDDKVGRWAETKRQTITMKAKLF